MGNTTGWSGEHYRWNCYNNRRNTYRLLELLRGSVPQPLAAGQYSVQAACFAIGSRTFTFAVRLFNCSKTEQTLSTDSRETHVHEHKFGELSVKVKVFVSWTFKQFNFQTVVLLRASWWGCYWKSKKFLLNLFFSTKIEMLYHVPVGTA